MLVAEDRIRAKSFKFRMEECDQCQIQTSSPWLELGQLPTCSLQGDGVPGERTLCLAWLPHKQVGSMPVVHLLNLQPRAAQLPVQDSGVHSHQAAGDACCRRVAFCFLSREPPCQGDGLLQHIPCVPRCPRSHLGSPIPHAHPPGPAPLLPFLFLISVLSRKFIRGISVLPATTERSLGVAWSFP